MRRALPAIALIVLIAAGCSTSVGPTQPGAPDQVTPDDAVKATGARAAAFAFVQAYADETGADVAALEGLVGTKRLHRWAHWLRVQNREFPGSIAGSVAGAQVGPAAPFSVSSVPGSESILRQVDVSATVTFRFEPTSGDPISVERSLDGPMRLVLDPADGSWKVLDFTRDGLPLSAAFETVKGATITMDGITIVLDAFLSEPYWEFFLTASGDRAFGLTAEGTALSSDGKPILAQTVTRSLAHVAADSEAEGIATFAPQPSAAGLALRIRLTTSRGVVLLSVSLDDLIHPIPLAAASASPSA